MVASPSRKNLEQSTGLAGGADIITRMISAGQPHKAVPLTGALCLAVAARIPDSIAAANLASGYDPDRDLRVAHPSGIIPLAPSVRVTNGIIHVKKVTAFRTARRLMEGRVFYRSARITRAAARRRDIHPSNLPG